MRRALDRIAAPTLIVWGTADRVIPSVLIDDLAAAYPAWEFERVVGVGHLLPLEAPETYVRVVGSWVGGSG